MATSPHLYTSHLRRLPMPAWAKTTLLMTLAAILGSTLYGLAPGLPEAPRITLGIFAVAAFLWVTEAVPLFVTSLIIVGLETVLLGLPDGPLGFTGSEYKTFFTPFFSPTIALFVGGFCLGAALHRHGLDTRLAAGMLSRAGTTPASILAWVMGMTAFLSMWMSNTATTALMMAVALSIMQDIPVVDPYRKALVLGIPFAANIGGMGTPVGTPPNAIALETLAAHGIPISFLQWMTLAMPVVLVLLLILWWLLLRIFPPRTKELHITLGPQAPITGSGRFILVVFGVTALLWLTAGWHGIPEGVVALLPVALFFGFQVLQSDDVKDLGWDVLLIIGGGMSLGLAIQTTGLSNLIVEQINLAGIPLWAAVLAVTALTALLATFISHTATASLFIPIVIGLGGPALVPLVLAASLAASCGMALPISTPPNAIAYGSKQFTSLDMARGGAQMAVAGVLAVTALLLMFRF